MIKIIQAKTPDHINQARSLFREYEEYLGVDLRFQDFEQELASLPGKYASPQGCILLAIEHDKSIGCVAVRPLEHDICEMKRLYVRPDFRNEGLGKTLVEHIIEKAKDIGYRRMRLDTLNSLEEATHLYQKFGFTMIEPYYHNPLKDTIYWELELNNTL